MRSRPGSPTLAQRAWRRFCQLMTAVFYRRFEVTGLERLPADGPVILCANHVNALVDAIVVQASSPRPAHPIARSGLFRNPLLRPILALIQAVPIYRRHPGRDTRAANEASFGRLFELLGEGRVLLIFPEGQSHSDPQLRPLKSGAARLALGLAARGDRPPVLVPVGLTFPNKGRFRSEVLVQYGETITVDAAGPLPAGDEVPEEAVQRLTEAVLAGLRRVTLNVDSWQDLRLLRLLQTFFLFRSGRRGEGERPPATSPTLADRFRSLQRLVETHRRLRLERPLEVRLLADKLQRFEGLCRRHGVQDYHLELRYDPWLVLRFLSRCFAFALFVVPLAVWGFVNSALPYFATLFASRRAARGRDQYDSAGMLFGLFFFLAAWGLQTFAVYHQGGTLAAGLYAASLPITAAVALKVGKERRRIVEEARIFLLFLRRKELQHYLRWKRQELEVDLAQMARTAQRFEPPGGIRVESAPS